MGNKYVKVYSTSLEIKKWWVKTTMELYFMVSVVKKMLKRVTTARVGEKVELGFPYSHGPVH